MKVRLKKNIQNATMIFTDREEPRKSFWKKYHGLSNDDTIQVLSYYGIGGIGKTSLLKKLIQEMDEKLYKPYYVYYDFKYGQQCHQVLSVIKDRLASSYNFTFPLFELGLYSYCNKVGIKADSIEVKKLTEQSPTLDLLLDIVGNIPMVGMATTIFSLADKSAAFLLTQLKNHKKELLEIEYMDAENLYKHLPYLFSQDLSNNLEKVTMPLVVFLDTYESLVNELHSMGEPLLNDTWIRSETGIIQNTSNVLWVIAGREKLKWNLFDEGWNDSLEQHILGSLSQNDTDWFFKQSGIVDTNLRNELYALTNGVPIYLDLCVERYRSLVEMNAVVTIDKFGSNTFELVERFVRYMSDSQKDLIYTLACLGSWTDELILKVAETALTSFSMVTYEKCMNFSFVYQDENGIHKLHDTIKDVLYKSCPKIIRESVSKEAFTYYDEWIKNADTSREDKITAMERVLQHAKNCFDDKQWETYFDVEGVYITLLVNMAQFGYSKCASSIFEELLIILKEHKKVQQYYELKITYAKILKEKGEYEKSILYLKEALCAFEKTFGEQSEEILMIMDLLINVLIEAKRFDEIKEYLDKIFSIINEHTEYEYTIRKIGFTIAKYWIKRNNYEKAYEQYTAMLKLESVYSIEEKILIYYDFIDVLIHLEYYDFAKVLCENLLNLCSAYYGEHPLSTIKAKELLARVHFKLNKNDAITMQYDAYCTKRELLGNLHIETLESAILLATMHLEIGRYSQCIKICEKTLEESKEMYPEYHPLLLKLMKTLVYAFYLMDDYDRAIALTREELSIRKLHYGENSLETLSCESLLIHMKNKKSGKCPEPKKLD